MEKNSVTNKAKSTFRNMVISLAFVTLTSSVALAFIYELTKDPIEEAQRIKIITAIENVMPEFNNIPTEEMYLLPLEGDTIKLYPAKKDGILVGTAVETFSKIGFNGTIRLIVGLQPDGAIYDISVIKHKETPGLGDKIEKQKSDFTDQFKYKYPDNFILQVSKDNGDVDAITAATISSRAFCDAVQRAWNIYKEINEK
jgi:electron transport complex protein RnfG